ncbi:polysaccharide lyase 8 family protein [Vibrio sp. ZSDZ65]|uniref:Polysaccharide lyase 8 family protein n=1 Tax=Vibrio qingdaonensis TaxID=2829491 RepID=A0A9X3HYN1_9VIBR|nr:polysaccharide lyase 8 family protein [Vibrio qingdaonensis]MCW8348007.1 polysaccharide lyase 8 family protein [Vibrio qingdaonensis]
MKKFKLSMLSISVAIGFFSISQPALAESTTPNHAAASQPITSEQASLNNVASKQELLSQLRHRWATYFLGDPSEATTKQQQTEIVAINKHAQQLLNTIRIEKTGLWDDLPLDIKSHDGRQTLGVPLFATYQRLFKLARAYKLPGGELEGNSALLETLVESLAFLNEEFYHVGMPEYGNWWQWELGISRVVNNTLVILYDDIPYEIVSNYVDATRYFVPRPTHLSEGYGAPYSSAPMIWKSTGGNRTDNAQVVLVRGLLDNNEQEIKAAVFALSSVIPYVKSGDGFYQDGSYIQHKDLPYSGTYGQVMLQGLGMQLSLVANTPWQATDPNLQKIYPLILKAYAPLLVNGRMMDFVNGRATSRAGEQNDVVGQAILSAMLLYVDGAPEQYRDDFIDVIASQLHSTNGLQTSRNFNNYQLAQSMLATRDIKATPTASHIQFSDMDRVVHHRDNWTFGVAMHSNRVGNYESINGENLKGWHTADGMTYLYTPNDRYHQGFWPLVDPYKLPGTTTLLIERELGDGQLSAQRNGRNGVMNWTGGAALNQYGVAGMKFVNHTRDLSAHKSWFMFDNEIIALGSDIENSSDAPAITTIDNRLVADGASLQVNGETVTDNFKGIANHFTIKEQSNDASTIQYSLLTDTPIEIVKQCREGNWSDIGTSKGTVSGCFYEATMSHDQDRNQYAYMITPSMATPSQDISILANNQSVHAVEHKSLNLFAANFWSKGKAGAITSKSAMSIMTQESDGLVQVSVSNPTRSWFNRSFTIDGQFELLTNDDPRVKVTNGNEVSVDLDDLSGSSYTFTLKRIK